MQWWQLHRHSVLFWWILIFCRFCLACFLVIIFFFRSCVFYPGSNKWAFLALLFFAKMQMFSVCHLRLKTQYFSRWICNRQAKQEHANYTKTFGKSIRPSCPLHVLRSVFAFVVRGVYASHSTDAVATALVELTEIRFFYLYFPMHPINEKSIEC